VPLYPIHNFFFSTQIPDPVLMPFSTQLVKTIPQLNSKTPVKISCWYSPHEFLVHLESKIKDYDQMMRRLQIVYNKGITNIGNDRPVTGNYVVAKNRKDNLWYRAKLTDHNPELKKYKLEFVDVGNRQISNEDEVCPIVEEFINLPIMAIKVSLDNIVSCCDWTDLTSNLNRYISPQKSIVCEFRKVEGERFFASVQIENDDLKTSLINDNFVTNLPEGEDNFT
jgi:Tudor domain